MKRYLLFFVIFFLISGFQVRSQGEIFLLPIHTKNRQSFEQIELTHIGEFGMMRKARPGIPAHHHTGIDIKRPNNNYNEEPVFSISKGEVISMRNDGPFAQIIIQHQLDETTIIWSIYEHIAGIKVVTGDIVDCNIPIARFMNTNELNQYGWQFDHLHLEILKIPPVKREPKPNQPYLYFRTYNLECYSEDDLFSRYFYPHEFFKMMWEGN